MSAHVGRRVYAHPAGINWRIGFVEDASAQTTSIDELMRKAQQGTITRLELDALMAVQSTNVWVSGGEVQIDSRSIEKLAESLGDEIR